MGSYEDNIKSGADKSKRIDISTIKYFWQISPLSGVRSENIPKFLRKIDVLKNFSDTELKILARYFHHRQFANEETIFKQNDLGIGFYFVFSGHVNMIVGGEKYHSGIDDDIEPKAEEFVLSLDRGDYFGELALLQDTSLRSATAIAKESCELLGIFKPDLEELINCDPVVASKLLQSISVIVANRLFSITKEVGRLKYKLSQLEK